MFLFQLLFNACFIFDTAADPVDRAALFLIACLIPSSTGLAAATMGIMGTLSQFAGVDVYIMVIIYLMALGLAKMITPCSIVVMTCTAAAHMSYGDWVKKAVPIVGILFVCCCVFLAVLVMI